MHEFLQFLKGTGLFLGTGGNLANGGPAGLLIAYCLMASLLFSVMVRPTNPLRWFKLSTYRSLWARWYPSFPFLGANSHWQAGLLRLSWGLRWVGFIGISMAINGKLHVSCSLEFSYISVLSQVLHA